MSDVITPTLKMDNPNDPFEIYSGAAFINFRNYSENVEIKIYQSWLPSPQINFVFKLKDIPIFLCDSIGQVVKIKAEGYFIWEGTVTKILEKEECQLSGFLNQPIFTTNINTDVKRLDFSLLNFRSYFCNIFQAQNKSNRFEEIKFEAFDHSIRIHSINKSNDQIINQGQIGGYFFTNVGSIQFKDGASFERVEFIRKRLGVFLSFINGRRSYPLFFKAYSKSGALLWEDFTSYHVDQYKFVVSWMPFKIEEPFTLLWAKFLSITEENEGFEIFSFVIHWYLEALNNSGYTKGSIMMVQTAFEILYNWLVKEKNMFGDYTKENQHWASNKLRTLLYHYGLNLEIPTIYSKSFENIRWIDRKTKREKQPPFDFSFWFTEIRNLFVHFGEEDNKNRKLLPNLYDWYLLNTALFNLEVILLKMMGYKGLLTSRFLAYDGTSPNQVHIDFPYKSFSL